MSPGRHLRALLATWQGRFIVAFLAAQMLLPLSYYVVRRDPHDERFAWRMFSPMRMTRCQPAFTVNGQRVALGSTFHEAWIAIANRGRFVVLEGMAAKLCKDNPGAKVGLSVECAYLDRPSARFGHPDMCTEPDL